MRKLHVVTVATESKFYFPYLIESCKRNGTKLEVLGYGEEWLGFNWRFKKMLEFLKNIPDEDLVCFIDGYDILCIRNLDQLIPEFLKIQKETNCKIIVGSDQHYTLLKYWAQLTYGSCNNKLLNGGNYIGLKKDLIQIIDYIYTNNPDDANDDQLLLTQYCKTRPNDFYIDTESRIFLVYMNPFTEVQDITIKTDTNTNTKTVYYNNNKPFFVHTPGGFLDKLIIDLDYDYDYNNTIKQDVKTKVYNFSVFNQLKNGIPIFITLFVFIIIIVACYYCIIKKKGKIRK